MEGKTCPGNNFLTCFPSLSLSPSPSLFKFKFSSQLLTNFHFIQFVSYRIVLLMILVITFLGTCFDIFIVKYSNITKLSTGKRCLIAFSIPRNFSSVWDTGNTTETNLGCLHGFRFLTIGWVVMGHTYALTNHQAFGESLTHSLTHSLSLSLPLFTFFSFSGMKLFSSDS